ncbi:MAG: hypothetical protein AAF478_13210 [Pseudomonadota bacterium]
MVPEIEAILKLTETLGPTAVVGLIVIFMLNKQKPSSANAEVRPFSPSQQLWLKDNVVGPIIAALKEIKH